MTADPTPTAAEIEAARTAYGDVRFLSCCDKENWLCDTCARRIAEAVLALARPRLVAEAEKQRDALAEEVKRLLDGYPDGATPTDFRVMQEANLRFAPAEFEVDAALREFCPESNAEGNEDAGQYVCLNEDGDVIIGADTAADAIRQGVPLLAKRVRARRAGRGVA